MLHIDRYIKMSLDGQIRTLAKGLHESTINLDALLLDRKVGKFDIDLSLSWVNLRRGFESDVVEWATSKYEIGKNYSLMTTDGHKIGEVDLTEYDTFVVSREELLANARRLRP